MALIINFQEFVNSIEKEKIRIKEISMLLTKSQNVRGLLHNISNGVGSPSVITRHINEVNQIVAKENILDDSMKKVLAGLLSDYDRQICEKIAELNDKRAVSNN